MTNIFILFTSRNFKGASFYVILSLKTIKIQVNNQHKDAILGN